MSYENQNVQQIINIQPSPQPQYVVIVKNGDGLYHQENFEQPQQQQTITSNSESSNSNPNSEVFESNDNPVVPQSTRKRPCPRPGHQPRRRRRQPDPTQWKSNLAKKLKNSGQSYVSNRTGKVIRERSLKPPCTEKCKLRCYERFTEAERRTIFTSYWNLADINSQRMFISFNMEKIIPKRKNRIRKSYDTNCPTNSTAVIKGMIKDRRNYNNSFTLYQEECRVPVCRIFFRNTLGIGEKTIETVINKKGQNGFIEKDQRGKHPNHFRIDDEIKDSVRFHIREYPKVSAPTTSSSSSSQQQHREIIANCKTLSQLYQDYRRQRMGTEKLPANLTMYKKIFHSEFNIVFEKVETKSSSSS